MCFGFKKCESSFEIKRVGVEGENEDEEGEEEEKGDGKEDEAGWSGGGSGESKVEDSLIVAAVTRATTGKRNKVFFCALSFAYLQR